MKRYIDALGTVEEIDEMRDIVRANKGIEQVVLTFRILDWYNKECSHYCSLLIEGNDEEIRNVIGKVSELDSNIPIRIKNER